MDVKINMDLSLNLVRLDKKSSENRGLIVRSVNLNALGAQKLTGESLRNGEDGGKIGIFGGFLNHTLSNISNLVKFEKESRMDKGENRAELLKKQLEKLQKRLKKLEVAIKRANASKNPYAKEMVASLEAQKGAVFAQIMQISARILEMEAGVN